MSKRIPMTPQIEAKIRTAMGDPSANVSNLVVFEARSLTTEPIQRKSGFYKDARFNRSTLAQMAEYVSSKAIPLQVMHDTDMLPVGKVFDGQLFDMPNGETELRTMFYIPDDKVSLINDIENSIIDEVSVDVLTNKAICSECEFDYFGPEAEFANFLTMTCSNDHTIGEDGVHIRAVGLKDFAELSLVNRGAAKDAKILSRAKQAMGKDAVDRLAASAAPLEARVVTVNHKLEARASNNETSKGDSIMDKETLALIQAKSDEVASVKVELKASNDKLTAQASEIATLKASIESKDTEIKALKDASTDATNLAAKVTASENEMKAAAEKLLPHAKAALTASGVAEADLPKDVTALLSLIESKGLKLHQVFGAEPVTDGAKAGTVEAQADSKFRNEAFKTR